MNVGEDRGKVEGVILVDRTGQSLVGADQADPSKLGREQEEQSRTLARER